MGVELPNNKRYGFINPRTHISSEIVLMVSDIVKNSRSSFKERKERGRPLYEILKRAKEKAKESKNEV